MYINLGEVTKNTIDHYDVLEGNKTPVRNGWDFMDKENINRNAK